jgi:putative ABC transport system permease protein
MYRQVYSGAALFPKRGDQTLQLLGRLQPGGQIQEAATEIRILGDRLVEAYPDENHDQSLIILPLSQAAVTPNGRASFVEAGRFFMASALLLLLITCLNIACFLLVRTLARAREMAIRLSLGAGRGQLGCQLLTENLLLAGLSCAVCLLIAAPAAHMLWKLRPPFFEQEVLTDPVDGRVLAFGILISLLAGLAFGLLPMLQIIRSDLVKTLKGSDFHLGKSRRLLLGHVLIVSQIALCFSTLVCAGFFFRSLLQSQRIDPGFNTQNLITVSFDLQSRHFGPAEGQVFEQQLLQRVRTLPGVRSAAFAENRLLGGARFSMIASLHPGARGISAEELLVASNRVSPEYFKTVGIPILRGRTFESTGHPTPLPEVIVSKAMAEKLWGQRDPIGEPLFLDGDNVPHRVIGVARDAKVTTLGEPDRSVLYLTRNQFQTPSAILHLQVAGDPSALLASLRQEVDTLEPDIFVIEIRTIQEILRESLWSQRSSAMLLSIFSFLSLVLAGLGVYGVTAYAASQRRYEIGIRMALGAKRPSLVTLISSRGIVTGALGILLGLPFALGLHRLAKALLIESESSTLSTFLGTGGLVLVVSLIASVIPAVQIACTDPVILLRYR